MNELLKQIAQEESVQELDLLTSFQNGRVAVFKAPPNGRALAVGENLRVKVNANIGTSGDIADEDFELKKLEAALSAGTDTVMDLSTGGNLRAVRRKIVEASSVPVGSVPIYEAIVDAARRRGAADSMNPDEMLDAIRLHGEDGISFVTVHCGVTLSGLSQLQNNPRVCGIVSRGGSFLARWMRANKKENPLFERYDEVLDICKQYGMVLSLGDGLRPGAIADSMDQAQVDELVTIGQLFRRARQRGVQAIIEGPGHVTLDQIPAQVMMEKRLCDDAPFYLLGPLVTDIAPGFDHITSAIGAAVAAAAGADFLCYVTPSEHLGLPDADDVRIGVLAARISGHAGDLVRRRPGAREWDEKMSRARKDRNWGEQIRQAIDPGLALSIRRKTCPEDHETCTMCGDLCAYKADSLI
ncbi:phosphomethylpyrimidine synthase ThiC [Desulfomonile tiedjei]|uniref:Phosphomethylpyrimidine synthase n=1 Tax=Desulfomonile tiedjei (strain ATCC 49306 / DSM 6799 / DCB-1) TaxID=706587 RepID=I4C1P1_DESTA|nr:phosphomethylpyrimidine synthase ThiC [Desulfomonile tiedjei]AFM23482.1 thiamine biosynthesis protein ThiC [Desulfomonile tiedjei DSM 6799]